MNRLRGEPRARFQRFAPRSPAVWTRSSPRCSNAIPGSATRRPLRWRPIWRRFSKGVLRKLAVPSSPKFEATSRTSRRRNGRRLARRSPHAHLSRPPTRPCRLTRQCPTERTDRRRRHVADAGSAVPFAIPVETAWPPARFDSSSEVSILGSADSSTSQASDDPAADSSVVEFLQLLDDHSSDVFQQFGQRYAGGQCRAADCQGLARTSSQFLRDLVKGLAHKARSKRKKRVVPKTSRDRLNACAKSERRDAPSPPPKPSTRKKSSRRAPDRD